MLMQKSPEAEVSKTDVLYDPTQEPIFPSELQVRAYRNIYCLLLGSEFKRSLSYCYGSFLLNLH